MGKAPEKVELLEDAKPASTSVSAYLENQVFNLNGYKGQYNAVRIQVWKSLWTDYAYKTPTFPSTVDYMQISKDGQRYFDVLPRLWKYANTNLVIGTPMNFIWTLVVKVGMTGQLWLHEQVVKMGAAPTAWHLKKIGIFTPCWAEEDSEVIEPVIPQVGLSANSVNKVALSDSSNNYIAVEDVREGKALVVKEGT